MFVYVSVFGLLGFIGLLPLTLGFFGLHLFFKSFLNLTGVFFRVFNLKSDFFYNFWRILWMRSNISATHPIIIFFRLVLFHKRIHREINSSSVAIARPNSLSIFHPSFKSKVGRFSNVEAVIKSRVVGIRKNDDNVSFLLDHSLIWNAILIQNVWSYQTRLVPHEI